MYFPLKLLVQQPHIKIGSCVWLQINDQHLIGFQSLKTAGHNFNGNIWTTYTFAPGCLLFWEKSKIPKSILASCTVDLDGRFRWIYQSKLFLQTTNQNLRKFTVLNLWSWNFIYVLIFSKALNLQSWNVVFFHSLKPRKLKRCFLLFCFSNCFHSFKPRKLKVCGFNVFPIFGTISLLD